jgi:hypothetical protein
LQIPSFCSFGIWINLYSKTSDIRSLLIKIYFVNKNNNSWIIFSLTLRLKFLQLQKGTLTVIILNQGQCDYFNQMRTLMFSQWDLLKHPKTEYVIQLIRSVITISGSHFINIV